MNWLSLSIVLSNILNQSNQTLYEKMFLRFFLKDSLNWHPFFYKKRFFNREMSFIHSLTSDRNKINWTTNGSFVIFFIVVANWWITFSLLITSDKRISHNRIKREKKNSSTTEKLNVMSTLELKRSVSKITNCQWKLIFVQYVFYVWLELQNSRNDSSIARA